MPFKPTTAQLETIAELETAKMPRALMSVRLGIDPASFEAWTARLETGRKAEAGRLQRDQAAALAAFRRMTASKVWPGDAPDEGRARPPAAEKEKAPPAFAGRVSPAKLNAPLPP
ncbi:MAG: hypothetical protein WBF43_12915 [Methylocella sp.]